jgi:predicted alpha-1,2-mannosidase
MSNRKLTAALAMFFLIGASSCCSLHKKEAARSSKNGYAAEDLVQYADPMSGTGGNANCFPGPVAPFGMIQWSPDTGNGQHKGGYYCDDTSISDFSLDHLSGVGCTYGEDFAMMPFMGAMPTMPPANRGEFGSRFTHGNESVRPGYYGVSLDNGIKVELTTTARSGFGRITYPSGSATSLMINAASDINHSDEAAINIDPEHREISGWSVGGFFCNGRGRDHDRRKVYFCEVFDRPFSAWSAWSNDTLTKGATTERGDTAGAYITFDTGNERTVLAKVAISYVSIDNARGNIKTESPLTEFSSADFDKTAERTRQVWNDRLNKIQVSGGTPEAQKTFYSMLYHALVGPCIVSDANGQYYGYDAKIHKTAGNRVQYGVFSGWDIYRSECQLLAMIAPKESSDMAQSLLLDYQQGGTFPRWGVATQDSGVMMGDPAAAMIADFYEFGARDFDTKASLAGLVRAANDPSVYSPLAKTHERDALADYLKLGYVPEHQKGGYGNVSMTLEYCSADFALAQFARDLGDMQDYAVLMKHAQNWQNTFNANLAMFKCAGAMADGRPALRIM